MYCRLLPDLRVCEQSCCFGFFYHESDAVWLATAFVQTLSAVIAAYTGCCRPRARDMCFAFPIDLHGAIVPYATYFSGASEGWQQLNRGGGGGTHIGCGFNVTLPWRTPDIAAQFWSLHWLFLVHASITRCQINGSINSALVWSILALNWCYLCAGTIF